MIERIILAIEHGDSYTDHLFMTAALRNPRILPCVEPTEREIRQLSGENTLVLRCDGLERSAGDGEPLAVYEYLTDTIHLFTGNYLAGDGTIDYTMAELAREEVEKRLDELLLGPLNQQELFREYFPLLWRNRRRIYSRPDYFYVPYPHGNFGYPFGCIVCLGAILRTMETDTTNFRLNPPGGCRCGEGPILIDYKYREERLWSLHTWCPTCGTRRVIKTKTFQRYHSCDRSIERTDAECNAGAEVSRLNLLDVVDALRSP